MRVISQCGTMDIPYESVVLSLVDNGNGCSVMAFSNCLLSGVTVARYSTEEKAKDAMSYLHGCYNEYIYDKYGRNSVDESFRFPSDSEV